MLCGGGELFPFKDWIDDRSDSLEGWNSQLDPNDVADACGCRGGDGGDIAAGRGL